METRGSVGGEPKRGGEEEEEDEMVQEARIHTGTHTRTRSHRHILYLDTKNRKTCSLPNLA